MGACLSSAQPEDVQARQRTQEIDKRLEEDYRRLRKEVKILLLGKKKNYANCFANFGSGSGESGKSTVYSPYPCCFLEIY